MNFLLSHPCNAEGHVFKVFFFFFFSPLVWALQCLKILFLDINQVVGMILEFLQLLMLPETATNAQFFCPCEL